MLRFVCAEQSPHKLRILDAKTGEDLTDSLACERLDLLVSMRAGESNRARMTVYAEGVDVLAERVELTVKDPLVPQEGAFLERELIDLRGEMGEIRRQVRFLDERLSAMGKSLQAHVVILQRLLEILEARGPKGAKGGAGDTVSKVG